MVSHIVCKLFFYKQGIKWINMENHVEIHIKLIFYLYFRRIICKIYYNDAGQNIGYLNLYFCSNWSF